MPVFHMVSRILVGPVVPVPVAFELDPKATSGRD
jgi:hypothetical protein